MLDLSKILVPTNYSVRNTFELDIPAEIKVTGYSIPDKFESQEHENVANYLRSMIPPIDEDYQFRKSLIRDILYWWQNQRTEALYLFGPTGAGKTSVWEQWCARLNIPMFMAKGHRRFETLEAFGQFVGSSDGSTPWVDGPLTSAAKYGLPVIINEYDRIAADRAIMFNDVFEGRSFPIPGRSGQMVIPQPGFRVVLTGNTNLIGDETGNYGTAQTSDMSLLERLYSIQVAYPDRETEKKLLEKVLNPFSDEWLNRWFDNESIEFATAQGTKTGSAISREEFIAGVLDVAQKIRDQSSDSGKLSDGGLERTMSTRMLRKWVFNAAGQAELSITMGTSSLHYSMKQFLSRLSTESTSKALHMAIETVFSVRED